MREDEVLDTPAELVMYGIRGETESSQLMMTPQENIMVFTVEASDLTNSTTAGSVLKKENIEIFVEKYTTAVISSNANPVTAPMYPGRYPDALVPIDRTAIKRENTIVAGENQGIWFNVNIPADTAPGVYTGKVTVTLDDEVRDVPMSLTVYNLDMPQEVHARTAYDIWYPFIQYGEGKENMTDKTNESYYWFLANKRVTPTSVPTDKYTTPKEYADYIVQFAKSPKVTGYKLIHKSAAGVTGNVVDKNYAIEVLTAIINKNIELRKSGDTETDLLEKAYFYLGDIIDEPDLNGTINQVAECDRLITEAKLAVKPLLNAYPDLQKSLVALPHIVVTTRFIEDLAGTDATGGIQTWCFQVDSFAAGDIRERVAYRLSNPNKRMAGENFWWYNCITPANPYPTFQLDDNLISSRVLSWMQYDYKVSGALYWCVNFFRGYQKGAYVARDIWNDAQTFNRANGDGVLLYPGSEYGLDHPISTLRLESIRESKEDYEYLWMFERKLSEFNKEQKTSYSSDALLQKLYSQLYTAAVPQTDSKVFSQVRIQLLDLLDAVYNNPQKAIELMDKLK